MRANSSSVSSMAQALRNLRQASYTRASFTEENRMGTDNSSGRTAVTIRAISKTALGMGTEYGNYHQAIVTNMRDST